MKNRFIIIFLFSLIKLYSQEQFSAPTTQINNPNIQPPNTSSFQKVNFLPVSNYTGRANIDIPFYEIDLSGLKIPINLSYNTGGIKVNDVASSVGLGWSLNAGGMISKEVEGIDDFYHDYGYFYDDSTAGNYYFDTRIGFLSYFSNHTTPFSFPGSDDEPDLFKVNAPGINLSFIHNRARFQDHPIYPTGQVGPFALNTIEGTNQNGQAVNIVDNNPLDAKPFILDGGNDYIINESYGDINYGMFGKEMSYSPGGGLYNRFWLQAFGDNLTYSKYGINSISIKNNNSFVYIFDKIDTSQYLVNRGPGSESSMTITYANSIGVQSVVYSTYVNLISYHLSKIIDTKTNKTIEFQYETYSQNFSEIIDNNAVLVNDTSGYTYTGEKGEWMKYPKLNRLSKIIFDKGYINFNYNLNRDDILGEKALTDIILYDKYDNQIKRMNLNFDYYQSVQSPTVPYSKRLKLKEVSVFGNTFSIPEKYKLTYNSTPLPLRSLAVSDFFGYHNGEANNFTYDFNLKKYVVQPPLNLTNPNPTLYFTPNKKEYSFFPIWLDVNSIMVPGNYSLLPNLSYCKAGILEKIEYPTGGYVSLDYELNKFKIEGQEFNGGGLRVKEQKISDGTNVRNLKFNYLKDDNTTSGSIVNVPKLVKFTYKGPLQYPLPNNLNQPQFRSWIKFLKYNTNKANIELTHGAYVGYSKVKVEELGKGFTTYDYSSPEMFPNKFADIIVPNPSYPGQDHLDCFNQIHICRKISHDNGTTDFQKNNDIYRGHLLNKSIYNQQGIKLKESNYNYSEKVFKNYLKIKFVPEEYSCSLTPCSAAMYFLDSQKRYLLTHKTEKEYFNGITKTKTNNFVYDANYSLIKEETTTDNLNTYRNEYYYPFDSAVQNDFGMSTLNSLNRRSEKVKTLSFKDNVILFEEKIQYNAFTQFGVLWPKQIVKYKSGALNNNDEIKSVEVTDRDSMGNICEVTDILGNKTSFIWGYNKTEIVAKIENVSYGTIRSDITGIQAVSNTGTESDLLRELLNLRSTLSSNPNATITTYTYKPLIGISTIIDPRGDKMTYEYDDFGRLKSVRDKNNHILSENEYHLKPQN